MQKYELVVIFDPDLDEAGINVQLDKIDVAVRGSGGSVSRRDLWGKRQMTYRIKKKEFGTYYVLTIEVPTTFLVELERQLRIEETILRHMVVVKDKFAPDLTKRSEDDSSSVKVNAGLAGAKSGEGGVAAAVAD